MNGWFSSKYRGRHWAESRSPILVFCRCVLAGAMASSAARRRLISMNAMPVDLLIETHFSGAAQVQDSQSSLCQLPSGIFRWQRPAVLTYPDVDTRQQIWQMESSLSTPTDKNNLAQRLYLTQRWMDLMMQEGFTPLPRAWGAF